MSKKIGLFIVAVFLLFTLPAHAGTRSCTTAMVTLNICRSTADVAYCLAIGTADPDAAGPLLPPSTTIADAFASLFNWQSPAPCTDLMVAAGICTSPQLGTLVPITKGQFADLQVRALVIGVMKRYLKKQADDAAAASSNALPDPDLGQ